MYVTLFIFVTLSIDINYLTFIQLDLIKEISNTFSKKTQKNFIKFFTRKRPSSFRKDVKLFEELIIHYNSNSYKKLTYKEWFFKVHWPEDPNMPGFLQIEALTQMCSLSILTLPGNKGEIMYLISADKLIFKKKVTPNSKFYMITNVIKYTRGFATFKAQGFIENELACSAEINLVLPKEIKNYKIK